MGTHRVTRLCGVAKTKEMAMLGDKFNAKSALEWGLVNEVSTLHEIDNAVGRWAKKIMNLPPLAVQLNKRIVDFNYQRFLRESQNFEIDEQYHLNRTSDFRESMQAFKEKRAARYSGE